MREACYHSGFIGKFGVGNKMPETSLDVWMETRLALPGKMGAVRP